MEKSTLVPVSVFHLVICTLLTLIVTSITVQAEDAKTHEVHIIVLGPRQTFTEKLNTFLHAACKIGYTSVKVLHKWCPNGNCLEDRRVEAHLATLPPEDFAVVFDLTFDYYVTLVTEEKILKKILSAIPYSLVLAPPPSTKASALAAALEEAVSGTSEENEVDLDEEEEPFDIYNAFKGGVVLGRAGSLLHAWRAEGWSDVAPKDSVYVDFFSNFVVYTSSKPGSIQMGNSIQLTYKPEEGEATMPMVLVMAQIANDVYNIIEVLGRQETCRYDPGVPLELADEEMPVGVVIVRVDETSIFLSEILQGLTKQDYPKEFLHLYIVAQEGLHEEEIRIFLEEHSTTYASAISSTTYSLDHASQWCEERNCDFVVVMDTSAVLKKPETLRALVRANRPVIAPYLVNNKDKTLKSFAYSVNGITNWDNMITETLIKGIFRVSTVSAFRVIQRSALKELLDNRQVGEYLLNINLWGQIMDASKVMAKKKHPELWAFATNVKFWSKRYIHPDLSPILNGDAKAEEVCPQTYYLPVFSERFCQDIIEEADFYGKWLNKEKDDPEVSHQYSSQNINLEDLEYDEVWHQVINKFYKEILIKLYRDFKIDSNADLIYINKYSSHQEYGTFKPHLDEGTYTINLALNSDLQGGCKYSVVNTNFKKLEACHVPHNQNGWVVVQLGHPKNVHQDVMLSSGTRYALISIFETQDQSCKGPKF
ncbi:procollagen-lysine,2-oxoglutarate 5-dioxygenase 1-like [Oratosquilla oratoria]|uniref:procollagen-lysine,2-oxoglutarate 5-dioxygenase 1-like n=1 Tax=Oratosquilla oratoria TaxID=337810 RepID=UPI003F75FBDF